jgi:predicted ATPase
MMGFDVPSLALLGQDLCGPHVAVLASLLGSTAAAACAAGWTARGYSSSSERSVTDDPVSAGLESSSDSPSPASWAKQGVNKEQQKRGKAWPLFLQRKPLKDDSKHREAQYVYRVCLTGGPCGGKSSSQESLSKVLTAKGYDVYFAPEVPTILMNGGCVYPGSSPEKKAQLTAFEDGIIQMQMQMERSFTSIAASTGRASVVIFDRGLLDIPAYLPRQAWLELLNGLGFTEEYFAQRYDIVLHLVTTGGWRISETMRD